MTDKDQGHLPEWRIPNLERPGARKISPYYRKQEASADGAGLRKRKYGEETRSQL